MGLILLIILVLFLLGGWPAGIYRERTIGTYYGGGLGLIILIVIILALFHVLDFGFGGHRYW